MEARTIDGHEYHFTLGDEGTLDTVVEVFDVTSGRTETFRYGCDIGYRDADGDLDFEGFIDGVVGPDASAFDWDGSPASEDDENAILDADNVRWPY